MKHLFLLIIIFVFSNTLQAQKNKKTKKEASNYIIDSSKVSSLDHIIKTFYKTLSAEKDKERHWKQFRSLFKKEAKLIVSSKHKEDKYEVKYMSPDLYEKNSKTWLKANGFIQKEINRKVDNYNNIAQVFSSFESYHSQKDKQPFMRGIYSMQLLNDGKRWWIVNLYWTNENKLNPIPKTYLP